MKQLKNYLSILSMLIALSLLTFISCTPDTEKEDLICKVSVEISEGGIGVASNSEVVSGEEVTLKAVPEDTYRFVNWTVNGKEVSKENPFTTTITVTTQFKPNFEKDNYTIKVTAGEGGTAEVSETEVLKGTEVTLTATPNDGYSFVNWTLNGEEVSTNATYTVTVTNDIEYVANFISYKVTVLSGEGGTVTASKTQVGHNGKVTLTATPNEGYSFVNWTVNGVEVSTKNPYTATITEDTEFKANFISYKVTVLSGEGGTVTASKTQVGYNGRVTLTATHDYDYYFVNWTVNGKVVSWSNPSTQTITEDTEFKANFKKAKGEENGYVWIDLGLSVKWATCNVGATSPEEYGDYFAWGETSPKTTYYWSTYKYGSFSTLTKYCRDSSYGTVDNKSTLELTDDAARVNWGGKWRMPTIAELEELRSEINCTWTRTTQNGVNGYKVTSKVNGNSIFLPAAGSIGRYWSSSLSPYFSNEAWYLLLDSGNVGRSTNYRYEGRSVRAVCE